MSGNCTTGIGIRGPDYWQVLLTQIKSGLHPSGISAHGYCHVVLKTTPVPIYGHGLLPPRIIGKGYLFSNLNHLRSGMGLASALPNSKRDCKATEESIHDECSEQESSGASGP